MKINYQKINKISYWYGRNGNNLQQLIVGIYLTLKEGVNFQSLDHNFFNPIIINQNKKSIFKKNYSDTFFFQYEKYADDIAIIAPSIVQKYIKPSLKLEKFNNFAIDENTLVIHIRSGDLWRLDGDYNKLYVQNPLSYYKKLIGLYKKTLIVTELDLRNPLIKILRDHYHIPIISSTLYNDFSILMSAKNLSSSGVGTFDIAAALLSNNLKNFYTSDLYLDEQINPKILLNFEININMLKINNYIDKWYNNEVNNDILINHNDIDENFILQN